MGLFSWLRGNRSKQPRPPWVRPEFLGVFALLAMASLGIGYWAIGNEGPGGASVAAAHQEDYVGISVEEFAQRALLPCDVACHVQSLWEEWLREHPGAEVISKTPVQHEGVTIGYDVVYRIR